MNIRFPITFTIILLSETICAQSNAAKADSAQAFSNIQHSATSGSAIKWTSQLPEPVKKSFYKCRFANWFVEKIIRYNYNNKTFYRVFVNNGNLLDGDHHDSFLKTDSLDITDNGTILRQ